MTTPPYSRTYHRSLQFPSLISSLSLILNVILLSQCHDCILANIPSSIPRSNPSSDYSSLLEKDSEGNSKRRRLKNSILWNPSSNIDSQGFIRGTFSRVPGEWEWSTHLPGKYGPRSKYFHKLLASPTTIRQVPGDGNCLFHSITVALCAMANHTHVDMTVHPSTMSNSERKEIKGAAAGGTVWNEGYECGEELDQDEEKFDLHHLFSFSRYLRHQAVNALSSHGLLFLQGNDYLRASDLVQAAAAQYDISGEEYCSLMRKDCYWGGGPEIVALCNVLRRPIHVYELCSVSSPREVNEDEQFRDEDSVNEDLQEFRLRRMACFGSPKFDRREPLHILSADSRFPDIKPGKQNLAGNHFLAMLPEECMTAIQESRNRRKIRPVKRKNNRVRGGARERGYKQRSRHYCSDQKQGRIPKESFLRRLLSSLNNIYAKLH